MRKKITKKQAEDKVAIYVRVSTHWQIDKDSLPMQKTDLANYCAYVLNINNYEIFEDAGYSAKNTDRPDFQKMMSRIRSGEFSHLLVWKIDRISRNLLDFIDMYEELKRLGVAFVSRNEQFDTTTAMGEAMLKIILVFAELERNTTSERVSNVMISRAETGKWNGGRVPYGYVSPGRGKMPVVDEIEAAVVKQIFNNYESSRSTTMVARDLSDKGILTKAGNKWSATTISKILGNRWYIGSYIYNMRDSTDDYNLKDESEWVVVDNHHEPIISRDQFNRVQETLSMNTKDKTRGAITRQRKNAHIFSCLLECGQCGGNMAATIDRPRKDGTRPSIYGCYSRRSTSKCTNKYVSDVTLLPFMLSYIKAMMLMKKKVSSIENVKSAENFLIANAGMTDVKAIEGVGETYKLLKSGSVGIEYEPGISSYKDAPETKASMERLRTEYGKNVRALNRMKSLFLYGDDDIDKASFLKEQHDLEDEIKRQETILARYESTDGSLDEMDEDEFEAKASYVIMAKMLTGEFDPSYDIVCKTLDPMVLQRFFKSIIDKVGIVDGKVCWIRFRNSITHKFMY